MTKKIIALVIIMAILIFGWLSRVKIHELVINLQKPTLPNPISRHDLEPRTYNLEPETPTTTTNTKPISSVVNNPPTSFNLQVPFTTQAPFANWDLPYQEACEEAALLTVYYYWQDKTFTPQLADEEIKKIVEFENKTLGRDDGYKDTSASTTAWLAEQYWPNYQTRVVYDWNVSDVASEVAAGHPVIIFAYGKALGNPNYRNGGPLYHALVIKGYTPTQFITNDVGTRKGADYIYKKETVINASHDWNDGDVPHGQRAMLVMWPH